MSEVIYAGYKWGSGLTYVNSRTDDASQKVNLITGNTIPVIVFDGFEECTGYLGWSILESNL